MYELMLENIINLLCRNHPCHCSKNMSLLCVSQHHFSALSYKSLEESQGNITNKSKLTRSFRFIHYDLPIYLYGLLDLVKSFKQFSTTALVQLLTLSCWYALPPIVFSIASLIVLLTSSTTNWFWKRNSKYLVHRLYSRY